MIGKIWLNRWCSFASLTCSPQARIFDSPPDRATIKKGKPSVNIEMQNNVTKAAQGYLNAVRQLRWFNVREDVDALVAIVPTLVDAGYDRSEILDALVQMGQDDEEAFDIILGPIAETRPWMNWGRSLN